MGRGRGAPGSGSCRGAGKRARSKVLDAKNSQEVMHGGRARVWTRLPCPYTLWPDFSDQAGSLRRVDESDHYWQRESGPRSRPFAP